MYTVARSPRRSPKANVEPPGTPTPHCLAAGESGRAQSNSDFTTGLDNAWSKYTLLRLPSTGPLQKTTPSENSLLMMIISVVPGAALAEYGGIGVVNMGGPVGSAAGGLRPGVTGTITALPSGAPAPSLLTAPPPLLLLPPPPPLLLLDWVAPSAALAFLGSGSSSESSSSSSSSVLRLGLPSPSCRRFWYRGLALAGGAARDAPEVGAGRCSSPESSMPLGAALDAAAGSSPVIAELENKDGRASAACTGSLGGGFSGRFLANSWSLSSDLFSTEGGVAPTRMPSSSSLIARAVSPSRSSIAALTS
mmetsp:Transcript_63355/g.178847  ORF Transcript_63355/g.178847 Transcript_63355/m.178847 type:complete len:307 (+) Transcript_63355:849-1769(+)